MDNEFALLGFFNRIFHPDTSPTIHTVDLRNIMLGTRALLQVPDLITCLGLERLRLTNCGMPEEVDKALATQLLFNATELKELQLGRNYRCTRRVQPASPR